MASSNPLPSQSPECSEVQELLYLFVAGELEQSEVDQVVKHLGDCQECRNALAEHTVLNQALVQTMPKVRLNHKMMRA